MGELEKKRRESDSKFIRLYEDLSKKLITEEQFRMLSAEYEAEQRELIVFNFVGEIHLPTDPQTERKETKEQVKTA